MDQTHLMISIFANINTKHITVQLPSATAAQGRMSATDCKDYISVLISWLEAVHKLHHCINHKEQLMVPLD